MVRLVLALIAGAVVGFASAQLPTSAPFSQKVAFRHAAAPVARLVATLAERFDAPLATSPSMSTEYVLVDVEDVPLGELLERIATVSSGRWSLAEGRYTLTRDARATAADEKADRAYRKKVVETAIAEALEGASAFKETDYLVQRASEIARDLAKDSPSDDAFQKMRTLENARPGQRLAYRLLSGIDSAELASIRPGQRVVFSDSPNRMQKPLKNAASALREWAQDRTLWEAARTKLEENPDTKEWASILEAVPAPAQPPSRILVAVSRGYEWFGLNYGVNVMLVAPDGTFTRLYAAFGKSASGPARGDHAGVGKNETTIEYSPTSIRLMAEGRVRWLNEDGVVREPSREFMAIVSNPEEHEPLGFAPSDMVFAVRKKMGGQLVACLPDEMLTALGLAEQDQVPTVEHFLRLSEQWDLMTFDKEGEWLLGRPRLITESRAARGDRAALGEIIRLSQKTDLMELTTLAAFAAKQSVPPMIGASGYLLAMAMGPGMNDITFGDWQILSLWGRLSSDQRNTLLAHGRLPLSSLTKDQLAIVNDMVYGADHRLDVETAPPEGSTSDEETDGQDSIDREPTEALVAGLPPAGYVALTSSESLLFFVRMKHEEGPTTTNLENLESVAWRAYARQRPDLFTWAATLPKEETWRIGTARNLEFKIRVSPRHFVRGDLRENSIPAQAPWITPDTAPTSIKKKIDELVERHRKAGDGGDGTDGR